MFNKSLILILIIVSFQFCAIAQEIKKDTLPETKKEKEQSKKIYSFGQFARETYLFVKQPRTWNNIDWLKIGVIGTLTISAMPMDERITNSNLAHKRYYNSPFIVGGQMYGEWYSIGGVAAMFGTYGLIFHSDPAKKITIELFQAGCYSEAVTEVLKVVIGRSRPVGQNAFIFKPFNLNDNYNSIPSGHSTAAMALSTVMSRHAHTIAWKILAYIPAGFTMFARIYQDKHWLSDVIPGAAIGYFTGNWVVDLHEGKRHRINVTSVYPAAISISLDKDVTQRR
ncbi:MAG: phosphatase PAP2 family protein [Bacteroidia bacterium]|nr:phosphatase PAP2 family protein [Bacteroidia bacterium]